MAKLELIATSAFGIEAIVAKELKELGFNDLVVENGKVTYITNEEGLIRSNLWLRCADRIHIKIGEFDAISFEELFNGVKAIEWANYFPQDANVIVNAKSVKSGLFSLSDIQSITKKAIIEKLKETYQVEWFEESGSKYPILVSILKDHVIITLDSSGTALHKRGYRENANEAPLKETMAAALIKVSGWTYDKPLADIFCGSGTIPIEAALIGLNIPPGIERKFQAEEWDFIPKDLWKKIRKEAYESIEYDRDLTIFGSDISKRSLRTAMNNAEKAGVDHCIEFKFADAREFNPETLNGFIISNPPYGERLEEKETIDALHRDLGKNLKTLKNWNYFFMTSDEDFEQNFGKKSDKNRKLYNGRIKCYYYQYFNK
ncbi:MAG: class I SAM-dependent RNA methyltransferase [Clostridiaceae bacterium]